MKTNLKRIAIGFFLLSLSVVSTIYLAWMSYPLEIQWLNLESVVPYSSETIQSNFHILMNYLTNPFQQVLSMPDFPSSSNGLHHFEQVKGLFHLTQIVFLLTCPFFVHFIRQMTGKSYRILFRRFFIGLALWPIFVGVLAFFIGFYQFFTLFHQILFAGDNTWLFNPYTDSVILILPEDFFLHCFVCFFFLYEISCLILIVWTSNKEIKK